MVTTTTTKYTLRPSDGWTTVASGASTFLLVQVPDHGQWEVASGSSAPTANAASGVGTLTLSDVAIANETVTINGTVLTWKASAASQAQVTVGGTAAICVTNLIAAINAHTVLSGIVVASSGAGTSVVITALTPGTAGNAITTTETMTNASWGGTTLASGVDAGTGVNWNGPLLATSGIPAATYVRAVNVDRPTVFEVIASV